MRNRAIALGVLIIIIIVVIVIIVSCSKNAGDKSSGADKTQVTTSADGSDATGADGEDTTAADGEDATADAEEADADAGVVENEKPVNLYTMDYNTMTCNKVTSVTSPWVDTEDLGSFGAFCSTDDSFPFYSETKAHDETWNSVTTDTNYKIGYELSFEKDGKKQVITILKPGDVEENEDLYNGDYPEDGDYSGVTGILGVWLYDDLHQEDGAYYGHISQAETNEDTLLTSIKLRPTPNSDGIENFVLKAFSYSSDKEFDSDGHYIGDYAAQVAINRE